MRLYSGTLVSCKGGLREGSDSSAPSPPPPPPPSIGNSGNNLEENSEKTFGGYRSCIFSATIPEMRVFWSPFLNFWTHPLVELKNGIEGKMIWMSPTWSHVVFCFVLNIGRQLLHSAEILHNEDIGREVDHVLLSAAVRHPQQVIQVTDRRT